jgi:hypothetical protein
MWNRATGRWIDAEKELRMEKACASRPFFMGFPNEDQAFFEGRACGLSDLLENTHGLKLL